MLRQRQRAEPQTEGRSTGQVEVESMRTKYPARREVALSVMLRACQASDLRLRSLQGSPSPGGGPQVEAPLAPIRSTEVAPIRSKEAWEVSHNRPQPRVRTKRNAGTQVVLR